ncbi:MAG: amidase domain-containing protein [Oscillospiraceae bacterium]
MKKCYSSICILLVVMLFGNILSVYGANSNVDKQISIDDKIVICELTTPQKLTYEKEKLFGAISAKESVIINGGQNFLYPTFDDIDLALKNLERVAPNYCALVKENIDLKELYDSSYEELLKADVLPTGEEMNALEEKISGRSGQANLNLTGKEISLHNEKEEFDFFYDIYENKAKNEEIMEYLNANPTPKIEELAFLLPYNTPLVQQYFENGEISLSATPQYFNTKLGINYASIHAENPASKTIYPYYSNGDCTNFVSQILIAGGVKMHDTYPDKYSGWWHRTSTMPGSGTTVTLHTVSRSWSHADTFVRFMGTHGNEYTSFYTLSSKVAAGDFIALDHAKDGDWDHVGFVTLVGSYNNYKYKNSSGVEVTKYYRDFKVAQHTLDYYDYVSSDRNGWETTDGTANYAIVRRNALA